MPTITPSGGGGGGAVAPPTGQEFLFGNDVSVGNGSTAQLTWDVSFGPQTLLDLTDPANPKPIVSGVYGISIAVFPDAALTAGGWYRASLTVPSNLTLDIDAAATAANQQPRVTLPISWYIANTDSFQVNITNHDGVASRAFVILTAAVQHIS